MARHHGTWENTLAEMLHVTSEESVRARSIDWVARSLHAEGIENDDQLAERLVGAAEHFNVPIELLITWIHDRYAGKEWTIERWARWCQKYADARKRMDTEFAAGDKCEPPRRKEPELPSYTCPVCGWRSYNPNDLANKYCGHCHRFEEP